MTAAREPLSDQAVLRAQAVGRLRKQQAFRWHLSVYLLVNGLLIAIWLTIALAVDNGPWFPWPVFPLLGWGIGLLFHRRSVYGSTITEADIESEMRRLRGESA